MRKWWCTKSYYFCSEYSYWRDKCLREKVALLSDGDCSSDTSFLNSAETKCNIILAYMKYLCFQNPSETQLCPPYEGPPYKKEGPPSSQGGANLITRRGHIPWKGGDLTPTGIEELKSAASMNLSGYKFCHNLILNWFIK